MRRMYWGAALLLLVLVLGILLSVVFLRIHEPLSQLLEQAEEAAISGDWGVATDMADRAEERWLRFRNLTAAVADHEPLEQMDVVFDRLEVVIRLGDREQFLICCSDLSNMAAAMADAQKFLWWNLL